jgi:RNA polymerase sigma-B factor
MTPQGHAPALVRADRGADDLVTLFNGCWAGDARARERVILRFLPLARALARRYEGRGEPLDDLVQVASVGLVKAVDRCSPGRVDAFAAYAKQGILGEIRRHFRDATWRVYVPHPLRERAHRVAAADRTIQPTPGRRGRTEAIASSLDLEPGDVAEAQRAWAAYRPDSLDAAQHTSEGPRAARRREVIAGGGSDYEHAAMSLGIARALRGLGRRDQTVVLLRLCCDLTQREIAARIGVSQMQISRILRANHAAVAAACGLADYVLA